MTAVWMSLVLLQTSPSSASVRARLVEAPLPVFVLLGFFVVVVVVIYLGGGGGGWRYSLGRGDQVVW